MLHVVENVLNYGTKREESVVLLIHVALLSVDIKGSRERIMQKSFTGSLKILLFHEAKRFMANYFKSFCL